ncbi:MAG: hypothetical protein CMH26_02080 [Micavibrio sp.]|nr:hypothetical protein [Micavibrio sp.]
MSHPVKNNILLLPLLLLVTACATPLSVPKGSALNEKEGVAYFNLFCGDGVINSFIYKFGDGQRSGLTVWSPFGEAKAGLNCETSGKGYNTVVLEEGRYYIGSIITSKGLINPRDQNALNFEIKRGTINYLGELNYFTLNDENGNWKMEPIVNAETQSAKASFQADRPELYAKYPFEINLIKVP